MTSSSGAGTYGEREAGRGGERRVRRERRGDHPRAAEATGKAVRTPPSSAWGSGAGGLRYDMNT